MLKLVFLTIIVANGDFFVAAKSQARCRKGEEWEECPGSQCTPLTCSEVGFLINCPSPSDNCNCWGDPRCICSDGKVKDDNGKCINPEDCPECGGDPNAVVVPCAPCPVGFSCAAVECIPNTCKCRKGYELDKNSNKCVPTKKQCNKPNEEYQQCVEDCSPGTCESIGKSYNCPSKPDCSGKCWCKSGYFRNKDGECVTKDQCTECGGDPNAVVVPCAPCPVGFSCAAVECIPNTCKCKKGYELDKNSNKCVPTKKQCNKPNEEYQQCVEDCSPGTCESIGKSYSCPSKPDCSGKCWCKSGYFRNKDGECVTKDQCTECGGDPNAVVVPCAPCPVGFSCAAVECIPNTCKCKKGYELDKNSNKCVPKKKQCNKPNEEYQQCVEDCSPGTCESIGKSYSCPSKPDCSGKCRCKSGYFRNKVGECITKDQCIKCNGTHEYFSCGPACDNVCATLDKQNKKNCPIINKRCNEKCYCEDGYARDGDNVCVSIDQCKAPSCQTNEVFSDCIQATCRALNCTQIGQPIACPMIAEGYCIKGCVCAENYLRASNGTCVPEKQCDAQNLCDMPNEEYQRCPSCSPGTCESIGKEYSCAPLDPEYCRGTCRCKTGYYRNTIGECITEEECLKCTGKDEHYSCGGACDNVCANLRFQNQSSCPIYNIKCNEMCYCDEGYARDDRKVCIPIDQCPPETTTTTPTPANCPTDGLQKLLKGSSAFTAKFLYEVVKNNPKTSVITSPFSLMTPMGELALYSEDDTYDELIKVLNLGSKDEIRCVFPQLQSQLSDQKDVILNLAARIFANADYPLSDNFLDDCKTVFGAEAENLNFNDAAGAADRINQWVEDQTNNRIQKIATPDMLSAATRLILANAIYFLGNWKHQFNPNMTQDRDFHQADNSVIKLQTMYQEKSFRYGNVDHLDSQVLELPYNGSYSFLIFLPNKNDGVLDLLLNLQDTSAFYDVYDRMEYETVRVFLPKINVTTETDLSDILPKTGIKEIFNPNGAGFSGILKNDETLFVSAAKQKAFVVVNELGTEAAAANVIGASATGAPSNIQEFNADHPFVFYILQNIQNQNNVLFCGAYTGA